MTYLFEGRVGSNMHESFLPLLGKPISNQLHCVHFKFPAFLHPIIARIDFLFSMPPTKILHLLLL